MKAGGFTVALCGANVCCLFESCLMRVSTTRKLSDHSMPLKCSIVSQKRNGVGGFETDTASRETHVHTRTPVRM